MFVLSLSAVLLSLRVASAMPFNRVVNDVRDTDVTSIALNERDLEYLAYRHDGTLYGRYPVDEDEFEFMMRDLGYDDLEERAEATSCVQLSSDDVQKFSGWSKIVDYADKNWGKGSRNIVTNPPEYADRGARACVDAAGAKIQPQGNPSCTTNQGTVQGSVVGTDGTVKLSYQQGYSSTASWSVTNTGELAVSAKISVGFKIPDVLSIGTEITTTGTFTNSQGQGFDTTASNQVAQELTVNNPPGKKCVGTFSTKTCNVGGQGSVKLIGSGWVWFNYDSATQQNGQGDKHYKWAANIESILPNAADRSSQIDITGNMKSTTNSDFKGKCT